MSDEAHDLYRARIAELEQLLRQTDERADAFRRIVQSIDHHLYINEITPDEAVHPGDRALDAAHTARYLRGEMSEVLCRLVGLDGVTRWIRGGGSPRRDGDRLIVEGIVRDATAEVHAEMLLQEASRSERRAPGALRRPAGRPGRSLALLRQAARPRPRAAVRRADP